MPSSPGMKQIRRRRLRQHATQLQVAIAEMPSRCPRRSKEFHNSEQAQAACASHAQSCALGARRTLAPASFHEDCSSQTTPRRGGKEVVRRACGVEAGGSDRNHRSRPRGSTFRRAPSEGYPGGQVARLSAAALRAGGQPSVRSSNAGPLCHRAFLSSTASRARIACSTRSNATPATSPACSLSSPWLNE